MNTLLLLDKQDRPREKLVLKGAQSLTDLELLQAMIGSGNKQVSVSEIAKQTLQVIKKFGADISHEQLQQITGLGSAKISEILAAFELAKRHLLECEQPIIDSELKAVEQLADIKNKKQEHFVVMTLDGANRLIAKRTITIGTLTSSLVHPREVFADAITDRAAGIIIAHNHPSGGVTPSIADEDVTTRIKAAGSILGIPLLDHLIITKDQSKSIVANV
jgi:DNA repair protein RadC